MMRVAELGLRAIARERGITKVRKNVPIKWAMWGEIIGALQKELDVIRNVSAPTAKKRTKKEAALEFYSVILGDMQAVLRLYRDKTNAFPREL
jgi:hypothetical protein